MIFVESLVVFAIIAGIWLLITAVMFKKLNRSRLKGVLLILLAFIGVGATILIVGHSLEWHEQNEFCRDMCHSMEAPYNSYTQPKNNTMMETHFEHNVTCAQCHSGPGIVGLAESFLPVPEETLKENLIGYDPNDFGGHVPSENCLKGCHEEAGVDWQFEAPKPKGEGYSEVDGEALWLRMVIYHPFTDNGTSLTDLENLETCLDCHDPRANSFGFAAEACQICHDVDQEEIELHGEYTCSMAPCHRDENGEYVQPKRRGHAVVEGLCTSCHDRDHPEDATVPYTITTEMGTFQANMTFCSGCHQEAYNELETADSKHFSENECQECHLDHKTRPDCLDCHDQGSGIEPLHDITTPFDECTDCHEQGGHNPLSIDFQTQDTGIVSRDFCSDCHQSDVYDKIENNELHTREEFTEDCLACHEVHEADVDCTSCHTDGGFGGLADAPGHTISAPLDECLDCHTEGHEPEELNFTFFTDTWGDVIENDFCVNCHYDDEAQFHLPQQQELTSFGFNHSTQDCTSCHTTHEKEDVDCLACHGVSGVAPLPPHNVQNQFEECTDCHESGHAPRDIFFGVSNVNTDFCSDISCHGGPGDEVETYQNYGGEHGTFGCTFCHETHISYDVDLTLDFNCTSCHSESPSDHSGPYTYDECLDCHRSAHSPTNRAPNPGYNLSQRDYMNQYFLLDKVDMTNSFSWIERGNHEEYNNCTSCHSSAEVNLYPASAQSLMNVSGTDCTGGGCHSWIDSTSTGKPYNLLSSATGWLNHTNLFNNATTGGCAGFCHQPDINNPEFDGTGHGTVASCLTPDCHGNGFPGDIHDDHIEHVNDFSPITGVECGEVCHKIGAEFFGEPIDGGCYDCHKSGHEPRILNSSPCSSCHSINQPDQP